MRRNYMGNNRNMNMQRSNISDYGNDPFTVDIEKITEQNTDFRNTIWTGTYMQLTLMSIDPGAGIGAEIHPNTDQFLRVESGMGQVMMGKNKENFNYRQNVKCGFAILIPAGTWHNVVNMGQTPLKLYSIYAPPHHPRGTVHHTKSDADTSETSR